MNKYLNRINILLLLISLGSICFATEYEMTEEQKVKVQQLMDKQMEIMKAQLQQMQKQGSFQVAQQQPDSTPSNNQPLQQKPKKDTISEVELSKQMQQYQNSKTGVNFAKQADGFVINNQSAYVDPEGEITNYGYDWSNGRFFYLIKTSPTQFKIKFNVAESNKPSLDIATLERNGAMYSVQLLNGQTINGNGIILTSDGFIVTRYTTAFIYKAGVGIRNFISPVGWHIADFQNGDVASTNFILLEKDPVVENDDGGIMGFIESTKELANGLGITKKEDYMLVDLNNPNKTTPIDITLGGKDIQIFSYCRQQNRFVSVCDRMDVRQSLYEPTGLKNLSHYYWQIAWFKGKKTNFSITKEGNHRQVLIKDLNTNKTVEAAYRATGYPEFSTSQDKNGVVKLHVSGGVFPGVDIEDAESFLNNNPDVSTKSTSK